MSHFGIDEVLAKKYFKTTFDLMEKLEHDAMLHDAYFYGLFPPEDVDQRYLDAFAEIKNIARKYPVEIVQPWKMPDVGTIGYPEEPCLNELTRLIRGGIAKDELCIVVGRPTNASAVRPEVLEFYKSRRSNPVLHLLLEDTKDYVSKRYLEVMGDATKQSKENLK